MIYAFALETLFNDKDNRDSSELSIFEKLAHSSLEKTIVQQMQSLFKRGDEVSIIVPFSSENKNKQTIFLFMLKKWLNSKNIPSTHIFCQNNIHEDFILNNRIDVLIVRSIEKINDLNRILNLFTSVISFGPVDSFHPNLYQLTDLQKMDDIICSITSRAEEKMTPLNNTGFLSIDKPFLTEYTRKQIQLKVPKIPISDYILYENREHLDDCFIQYFGNNLSYLNFEKKVLLCMKALLNSGVKKGDYVSLCMPNTPECIIAFIAIRKIGAIANMIHPLLSENEIKFYLQNSHSKTIIFIDIAYPTIKNILQDTEVENAIVVPVSESMPLSLKKLYSSQVYSSFIYKSFLGDKQEILPKALKKFVQHFWTSNPDKYESFLEKMKGLNEKMLSIAKSNEVYNSSLPRGFQFWKQWISTTQSKTIADAFLPNPDDVAAILQSGGSTGSPKGVEIMEKAFITEVEQFRATAGNLFGKEDAILVIMPFFHGFGLISSFYIPACLGVKCVFVPKFHASELPKLIEKYHITAIAGVPTVLKAMLKNEHLTPAHWRKLKLIISGGAPLEKQLLDELEEKKIVTNSDILVWNGYGQAETSTGVSLETDPHKFESSIGIPNVGNNFKIVKFGTEEEVPYDTPGELCVTGETIMKGFLNNPQATQMIRKQHSDGIWWIHTGDIVVWSKEYNRAIYINRGTDMIISNGYNLYPSEIAKVIYQHPGVQECIVVGIEDEFVGTFPKAFIVLKDNIVAKESLKQDILKICASHLAIYSLPREIDFVPELPKTSIGKIKVKELQQRKSLNPKIS